MGDVIQVDYLKGGNPIVVKYTDQVGGKHDAILTAVWTEDAEGPYTVNLVYVEADVAKNDQYGRQINRATSVQRKSEMSAHGYYFELV